LQDIEDFHFGHTCKGRKHSISSVTTLRAPPILSRSVTQSSRGYTPAPTVAVIKELQHLYPNKLVLVDEYNTSKLCSLCYSPLKQTKTEGKVNWCVLHCGVYWNCDVNTACNRLREKSMQGALHCEVWRAPIRAVYTYIPPVCDTFNAPAYATSAHCPQRGRV
jgi:hypothetical protein